MTKSASAPPDLEALRSAEPRDSTSAAPTARRPLLPRLTIGVLVLGGLAAVFAVLKPLFFPPRDVTLATVRITTEETVRRRASSVQAAGWVEADPFPITVRPLVRGVVERIDVVEGTPLVRGKTVIAVLRNLDLENALALARSDVALCTAEHAQAESVLAVAESLLEQKIHLRAAVAARAGELATARAETERARAQRMAAQAALDGAKVDLEAQEDLRDAGRSAPTALARAQASVRQAEARVTAFRFEEVRVVADLKRITDLLDLAREEVREPRELQGAVTDAASNVAKVLAVLERARTAMAVAQRNVDHLTVLAPADGVVLRLEAAPGAVSGPDGEFKGEREGIGSTGGLNRATGALCTLYDPARLQVRVDLAYADVPGVATGTDVEIEAKAVPGRKFKGRVSRLVSEADITQAKLQVKVRLLDPDALLRPEMICTARFLVQAEPSAGSEKGAKDDAPARLLVPTAALRGDAVFVYDPTGGGRARRVPVRVVAADDDWTEVEGELGLSTKLILEDVEDGERVKGRP